jgi:hypothetical protein
LLPFISCSFILHITAVHYNQKKGVLYTVHHFPCFKEIKTVHCILQQKTSILAYIKCVKINTINTCSYFYNSGFPTVYCESECVKIEIEDMINYIYICILYTKFTLAHTYTHTHNKFISHCKHEINIQQEMHYVNF